ncbi:MAG TPA: radical SAM protein [Elusimicrobiales bacterium]|nr:radical SAM protein [Elusimicrobiales bacterium]
MDFSRYLDQQSEPYTSTIYPPPECWGKMSSAKVLGLLGGSAAAPGEIMLKLAVPFCPSKCSFCGLSAVPDPALLKRYLQALLTEMGLLRGAFSGRGFFSFRAEGNLFSLSAAQLERVFAAAFDSFKFKSGHKSGIELNPASITREKAELAAGAGIKWAILGVQSRDPAVLSAAGCPHSGTDIEEKYGILRSAGIENISMDLMLGLPQQTTESFIRDVAALVKMRPERIALYRYSGSKKSRAELDYVVNRGFEQMEKAGYAFRKGFDPYWGTVDLKYDASWPHAYETGTPVNAYSILALGAGAKSYIWGRVRYQNSKDLRAYIDSLGAARLPAETGLRVSVRDEMAGYMILSFDCLREIPLADFKRKFGEELKAVFPRQLETLCKARIIKPCRAGYRVITSHDAARSAARRAFFDPALRKALEKKIHG